MNAKIEENTHGDAHEPDKVEKWASTFKDLREKTSDSFLDKWELRSYRTEQYLDAVKAGAGQGKEVEAAASSGSQVVEAGSGTSLDSVSRNSTGDASTPEVAIGSLTRRG